VLNASRAVAADPPSAGGYGAHDGYGANDQWARGGHPGHGARGRRDETLKDIRLKIFAPQTRGQGTQPNLREAVVGVMEEMTSTAGFLPSLRLRLRQAQAGRPVPGGWCRAAGEATRAGAFPAGCRREFLR